MNCAKDASDTVFQKSVIPQLGKLKPIRKVQVAQIREDKKITIKGFLKQKDAVSSESPEFIRKNPEAEHSCDYPYLHISAFVCSHTHTCASIYTHIYKHVCKYAYTDPHSHMCLYMPLRTHMHTHVSTLNTATHTHAHSHMYYTHT